MAAEFLQIFLELRVRCRKGNRISLQEITTTPLALPYAAILSSIAAPLCALKYVALPMQLCRGGIHLPLKITFDWHVTEGIHVHCYRAVVQ